MSNVRSLARAETAILVGGSQVDLQAERRAETQAAEKYPQLSITVAPDGIRRMPLRQLLLLEQDFDRAGQSAYERGKQEGHQAGYAQGMAAGQREARDVVASLSPMVADITAQREAILVGAKDHVLQLALKIAEKLTFGAAAINPGITFSIIEGVIRQLTDKSHITVKVHPDHLPVLKEQIEKFGSRDNGVKDLRLEADPRVRHGGCFIETPAGDIDARLDSMYEVLRQALAAGEETVR